WDAEYLARQSPVLEAGNGFIRKVKPLHRLSEKETASYAFLRRIDYLVEECPLVAGNTQMKYKQALDLLESASPGTKASFYNGFVDHGKALFEPPERPDLHPCTECGMPTPGDRCAFCRMLTLTRKRRAATVAT
ncbi:MAG TPA: tRNA(Ile)-lysidine synthetase, partial [Actinomycetota bacterium]|nr:tRNA(Ile)-lysidine synthetase [Actinomycetota bacterium]